MSTADETTARALRELAARRQPDTLLVEGGARLLVCARVDPPGAGSALTRTLDALLAELRARSSRDALQGLGVDHGYRIEDATAWLLCAPRSLDSRGASAWLERRVAASVVLDETEGGPVLLCASLERRTGFSPTRTRYVPDELGRVHVEAFEVHAVEHCNLRCANCCNMSPLVPERILSLDELRAICRTMAGALRADVVKIMGGEPLLHPELPAFIRELRAARLGERVRLFTNGLLLHAMPEAFWEALDELTISSYTSAPVPERTLDRARERALRHDFVLNIKPVREFSQVLSPRYERDDARVEATFERCWLRHRCLVVRAGRFFMCTRSAYADEFHAHVAHDPRPTPREAGDGVPIDADDLPARLLAYLNRSPPLGACRYCYGGDGAREPHYQLRRREVVAGVLSRTLSPSAPTGGE